MNQKPNFENFCIDKLLSDARVPVASIKQMNSRARDEMDGVESEMAGISQKKQTPNKFQR